METLTISLQRTSERATFDRFIDALNDRNLEYYAQDWMASMGYHNVDELHDTISPFIDALHDAHLNTSENIKLVYRCENGNIYEDWKLSLLGLAWLAFNSPHKTKKVTRLQLKILSDYLSGNKSHKEGWGI